jgi:hypothetical protein
MWVFDDKICVSWSLATQNARNWVLQSESLGFWPDKYFLACDFDETSAPHFTRKHSDFNLTVLIANLRTNVLTLIIVLKMVNQLWRYLAFLVQCIKSRSGPVRALRLCAPRTGRFEETDHSRKPGTNKQIASVPLPIAIRVEISFPSLGGSP